jgi:hypothetical protein
MQISSWDCNGIAMGLGFVTHFTVKSHFTCIDEATSSKIYLLNSALRAKPGLIGEKPVTTPEL